MQSRLNDSFKMIRFETNRKHLICYQKTFPAVHAGGQHNVSFERLESRIILNMMKCKNKNTRTSLSEVESMRIRRSSGDQWLALISIMVTKTKRSAEDSLSCSCCFSDKKIK